ncbi:hypothetical protein QTP88_008650 [Uroleucon formosanum]
MEILCVPLVVNICDGMWPLMLFIWPRNWFTVHWRLKEAFRVGLYIKFIRRMQYVHGFYNYEDLGKWLVYTYTILTQCIELDKTTTGFGVHILIYYIIIIVAIQQLYRKLRQQRQASDEL